MKLNISFKILTIFFLLFVLPNISLVTNNLHRFNWTHKLKISLRSLNNKYFAVPSTSDDTNLEKEKKIEKRENFIVRSWKNGREMDKIVFQLLAPAILNFMIAPLVGAVDTYWVGRMKLALALAGQGAANQIYTSVFWMFSFLPNVITPTLAVAYGKGDQEGARTKIGEALLLTGILGLLGSLLLALRYKSILGLVLKPDAPAFAYAAPYLRIRALTFLPALLATAQYSIYRGTMDVVTPLKIAVVSNLVNAILDPILMFPMKLGVVGAAVASCAADITAFTLYCAHMNWRGIVKLRNIIRLPPWNDIKPMLVGGLSVQLRTVALNAALISVSSRTLALDKKGTIAAAHSVTQQFWSLGGVILLALSSVASIIVPNEIAKKTVENSVLESVVEKVSELNAADVNVTTDMVESIFDEVTTDIDVVEPTVPAKDLVPTTTNIETEVVKEITRGKVPQVGPLYTGRLAANRLFFWGIVLGSFLCMVQLASLPLLGLFSPLPEVQKAARIPSIISASLQLINGVVFVGEGIQSGNQYFIQLAQQTLIAVVGMLITLHTIGSSLIGVWMSFVAFNLIRLCGVLVHHNINGPLTKRKVNLEREAMEKKRDQL